MCSICFVSAFLFIRRRYAYLAANAYKAGDAQAAKKFSQVFVFVFLFCFVFFFLKKKKTKSLLKRKNAFKQCGALESLGKQEVSIQKIFGLVLTQR